METNPVYLVSTAECLRIHCYATVKFRVANAPLLSGRLRFDDRQQILERLIKRSPVLDQHGTPIVLYYDHSAALTVSSLFFCKLSDSAIRAAMMQIITGVIEQPAKAVAPRVVLS
jgi:hypothetical protein